jgi:hypothetical protein
MANCFLHVLCNNKHMQFIRKSALGLCVSLLFSSLLLFGLVFGLFRVFGTSEPIKHALVESGAYQTVVGDALSQTQKEQPAGEESKIPLDDPKVRDIIKTAASPQLLQAKTEQALDALYDWVQGKTPKLTFVLELSDVKTNLASGLEQYIAQHVAALPVCARGDSGNIEDPFNATCRPEGVEASQVAAQAKDQLVNGEFLKEGKIDLANQKGKDGKTLEQNLQQVPEVYEKVVWGVYGLMVIIVLLSLGVVFLSLHWRAGLKKLAVMCIVIGSVSVLLHVLSGWGMNRAKEVVEGPLQTGGFRVGEILAGDLRAWWMIYGITLLVLGIGTLVALRLTRQKLVDEMVKKAGADPIEGAVPTPAEPTTPSLSKPRPRPPKKLVQ